MTSKEMASQISRPEVARMKFVAEGLRVGVVMGNRVLVEPVVPKTEIDRVEAEGLIFVPEAVKKDYTPKPSTGIVLQVGTDVRAKTWIESETGRLGDDTLDVNPIRPGAMVLFSRHAGLTIAVDKKDLLILDYGDIACTLEAVDGALDDKVQPEADIALPAVSAGGAV